MTGGIRWYRQEMYYRLTLGDSAARVDAYPKYPYRV